MDYQTQYNLLLIVELDRIIFICEANVIPFIMKIKYRYTSINLLL